MYFTKARDRITWTSAKYENISPKVNQKLSRFLYAKMKRLKFKSVMRIEFKNVNQNHESLNIFLPETKLQLNYKAFELTIHNKLCYDFDFKS